MKSEDFNKCRVFLEKQISEQPENGELLKAYLRLIELKSDYDKETDKAWIEKEIRETEYNLNYQAKVHSNNTDLDKTYHTNNTNHSMAWNQQQAENYRNDQNQMHSTLQSAFQGGYFPRDRGR
ncbi:hypothetical protein [Pseudomonas indica]|uniref:hypothetical protein n=1 Tax=Pseudomonas indica TaxID=137658 RepID=UPI0023F83409|nr:hypothetical protein [Pseudomonas indica]MBU3058783.1 hypothetical protein [Pseudomonas indica]